MRIAQSSNLLYQQLFGKLVFLMALHITFTAVLVGFLIYGASQIRCALKPGVVVGPPRRISMFK